MITTRLTGPILPHSEGGRGRSSENAGQTAYRERMALYAAYGSNLERLEQVKAAYDPTNIFHRARNITPALAPR